MRRAYSNLMMPSKPKRAATTVKSNDNDGLQHGRVNGAIVVVTGVSRGNSAHSVSHRVFFYPQERVRLADHCCSSTDALRFMLPLGAFRIGQRSPLIFLHFLKFESWKKRGIKRKTILLKIRKSSREVNYSVRNAHEAFLFLE